MPPAPRTPSPPAASWREYRIAIWMVFVGVAVAVLVTPWVVSVFFFGGAIGIAVRVTQRRRQRLSAAGPRPRRPRSG